MISKTLNVRIPGGAHYEILIGRNCLADAGTEISKCLPKGTAFVVYDDAVEDDHLPTLRASLEAQDFNVVQVNVPSGEASKCWHQFERVTEALLDHGLERGDFVVALGGGVIGDLAGYVAASVMRGVPLVQIPTTLLSQVDSSVGGKTGINSASGKNLVGAFKQPALVLIDHAVLDSLPRRELIAGMAEVIKYGCINQPAFFSWLEQNVERILAREDAALDEAIAICCRAKADVVEADETERTGQRALLNLGHTFGHALEAEARYDGSLLHGEGVAIGMSMAFELSARMDLCSNEEGARVRALLSKTGLPTSLVGLSNIPMTRERLIKHMQRDKKVSRGVPKFILARGIGEAFQTSDVEISAVETLLDDYLSDHG